MKVSRTIAALDTIRVRESEESLRLVDFARVSRTVSLPPQSSVVNNVLLS